MIARVNSVDFGFSFLFVVICICDGGLCLVIVLY